MKPDIASVLHLLHESSFGTLATHSTQLPGYPYASALPFVPDDMHRPVFLLSRLAEHTANLQADARTSLMVFRQKESSVLAGERLTLLGKTERIAASPELVARYLRYQPEAEQYLGLGDFAFFRFQPERARHIGGFARMGWIEQADWASLPGLAPDEESLLLAQLGGRLLPGRRLLGLDRYGADLERDGLRLRLSFAAAPATTQAMLPALLDCLALDCLHTQ